MAEKDEFDLPTLPTVEELWEKQKEAATEGARCVIKCLVNAVDYGPNAESWQRTARHEPMSERMAEELISQVRRWAESQGYEYEATYELYHWCEALYRRETKVAHKLSVPKPLVSEVVTPRERSLSRRVAFSVALFSVLCLIGWIVTLASIGGQP